MTATARIYRGRLRRPLEWSLKTVPAPCAYMASVLYHETFWYPIVARACVRSVFSGDWGRLFRYWETVGCLREAPEFAARRRWSSVPRPRGR